MLSEHLTASNSFAAMLRMLQAPSPPPQTAHAKADQTAGNAALVTPSDDEKVASTYHPSNEPITLLSISHLGLHMSM